jgi:signal transduction histidine kinase
MTSTGIEPIDSRLALRVYAAIVGTAGIVVAAWGQIWMGSHLAELPWGRAVVIRIGGAVMVAAAICALGLATADARSRKRMLSWFIAAHVPVWLMLTVQSITTLGEVSLARQATWGLAMVILGLFYVRMSDSPWGRPSGIATIARVPETIPVPDTDDAQQIRDAAAQEERNRLARELHDAVKQQIFAIQTSAATAETRFDADPAGARDALAQVRQSAREAMAEMEAMLEQLRATPLGNTGLVEAIRKQCDALAFRTGVKVDLRIESLPADDALPAGAHQAIFRIAQEALANVARHARAHFVQVCLATTPQLLELRIHDNGVGFDPGAPPAGMGLHNMRARAAEIGGALQVAKPQLSEGTIVTLSIPYETLYARTYHLKQTLQVAAALAVLTTSGIVTLLVDGPRLDNAFILFFALAFAHYLRAWLELRRRSGAAHGPTAQPIS